MKKVLLSILAILLVIAIGGAIAWFGFLKPAPPPISAEDKAAIQLMPLPTSLSLNEGNLVIMLELKTSFINKPTSRLEKAVKRFQDRLDSRNFIHSDTITAQEQKLIIDYKNANSIYPEGNEDESYQLKISDQTIYLTAPAELGILHGLETILQLAKKENDRWVFPFCEINDSPRYPWRGLMIDACRHWIPQDVILRNLDAMAAVKMNVLHWHLTEYQGFRVESKVFPKLHEMGSNGNYYTQEEIKEVINYAADRGIRVIPEFDLPGHATSWFVGHPELASAPGPYQIADNFGIHYPLLDPTREEVYTFLDQFFSEMATLFPDPYIHIGGDEINPTHWNESPEIQAFIKENNLEDHHGLQAYFNRRMKDIFAKHGKKMLGWDEILHPDLPKEGIAVQSWRNHSSLWSAAKGGNQAILSSGYYLDHQQTAEFHYQVDPTIIPNAVTIEVDSNNWKSWHCKMNFREMEFEGDLFLFGEGENLRGIMQSPTGTVGFEDVELTNDKLQFSHNAPFGELSYDLNVMEDSLKGIISLALFKISFDGGRTGGSDMNTGTGLPKFAKIEPLTPEQEANLLGGEACIWSEMVDARTIDSRVWPRVASIAEKLWSPKDMTTDIPDMYRRLMFIDDYILGLGIQHKSIGEKIIEEMVADEYLIPLRTLVSILKEQKMFGRMAIYEPEMLTTSPLNRVVDAARPESYVAYQFGLDVDMYLNDPSPRNKDQLTKQLMVWAENHEKLAPAFENVDRLVEVKAHSENLSKLAQIALDKLGEKELPSEGKINELIEASGLFHGGTNLAILPHIQKLIQSL